MIKIIISDFERIKKKPTFIRIKKVALNFRKIKKLYKLFSYIEKHTHTYLVNPKNIYLRLNVVIIIG